MEINYTTTSCSLIKFGARVGEKERTNKKRNKGRKGGRTKEAFYLRSPLRFSRLTFRELDTEYSCYILSHISQGAILQNYNVIPVPISESS